MIASTQSSKPDFESAIAELESIVQQMEAGNLSLEQSLHMYKRGAELLQTCQRSLTEAEQQVRLLSDTGRLDAFESKDE